MSTTASRGIGVLTSGGDAPGMNAAVRAVVRTALARGARAFAIEEGYEGLVEGGTRIRPLTWGAVGGILQQGGTVIGTARSERFRTREGRLSAAQNLIHHDLDGLVVIGGDGSLTGADCLSREWPELLRELVESGRLTDELAARHPALGLVGLVGSIDNDTRGTDMTIGADTALHRIVEAVDAIESTAASHQRTFVIEVMGRQCGYLALMAAIATGANWLLIPESPPSTDDWPDVMAARLAAGRAAGKRDSMVIVAEGARDRHGRAIRADDVRRLLEERLGVDVRVTILGHVQRGGAPSAFDRYLSTVMGHAAALELLSAAPGAEPQLIGMKDNRITRRPLAECVAETRRIGALLEAGDCAAARALRGPGFEGALRTMRTLVRARPRPPAEGQRRLRLAIVHSGGLAPGMNTAVRAAVRLALDRGHEVLGVRHGFQGLIEGQLVELGWTSVNGWARRGGAELGTNRRVPGDRDFYAIARQLEERRVDALLMVGGWTGYRAVDRLVGERERFPAFAIPIVCLPASIDNNLPGSELSIGCDTALNSIVAAVDKIKQSAVASQRCFVVEVMGRACGYLALMSALATGAERAYLNEDGVTLADLQADIARMKRGFAARRRLGLVIRNEEANRFYTTPFMAALYEEEGGELFDVRQAILGHLQQGGDPSPFDRTLATRLADRCVEYLVEEAERRSPGAAFIGLRAGQLALTPMEDFPRLVDVEHQRPREQWWQALAPIARLLAEPQDELP